jgi:hypothetical protein
MRKVLFQKFIQGVETQEYKQSNDERKMYDDTLKRFEGGTNIFTEMVHVGYFHGFLTNQYGEQIGHIEHEGEMLQVFTSHFKFVDSPEDEQLAEFAKAAMQGMLSNSAFSNLRSKPKDISAMSITMAKDTIAELKKQKP